jgi:ribose transport system substrate-binding protein
VTAAAAVALAACGSDSNAVGQGVSKEGTADARALIEALKDEVTWPEPAEVSTPVDLAGKTVWWVPIGDAVPGIHAAGEGFRSAVEAAGGSVKLCDGKFNPSDIGNCLKSAGDQGADAVVTYFVDYATIPNAFDALVDQEVPLVVGAAQARKPNSDTLAFWDTAPLTTALTETVAAASIVASGSSPEGIAILLKDNPSTAAATEAMTDKWEELCADCKLATVDHTTANQDKLPSLISAELVKNPNATVILSPDDGLVPSITQAVKTAGRTDVKIVSASGALPSMQNVAAGTLHADVGLPTNYLGWSVAGALFQLMAGDPVSEPPLAIRYFDSSNIDSLELTPEAYESNEWYGDDSFEAAYKAAWGIS